MLPCITHSIVTVPVGYTVCTGPGGFSELLQLGSYMVWC